MLDDEQSKLITIVNMLTRLTRSGAISWETRATVEDDAEHYEYSTAHATVEVFNDDSPRRFVTFAVKNSDGVVIGELHITQNTSEEFDQPIEGLFNAVRHRTLRIDETLDAIIADLDDEPPF